MLLNLTICNHSSHTGSCQHCMSICDCKRITLKAFQESWRSHCSTWQPEIIQAASFCQHYMVLFNFKRITLKAFQESWRSCCSTWQLTTIRASESFQHCMVVCNCKRIKSWSLSKGCKRCNRKTKGVQCPTDCQSFMGICYKRSTWSPSLQIIVTSSRSTCWHIQLPESCKHCLCVCSSWCGISITMQWRFCQSLRKTGKWFHHWRTVPASSVVFVANRIEVQC